MRQKPDPFYEQLLIQEKSELKIKSKVEKELIELDERINALRVLMKKYAPDFVEEAVELLGDKNQLPTVYNENLKQKHKAYVALYQIKKGFSPEISKKLQELDKTLSPERADKLAKEAASELYRDGAIGAKKVGLRHEYFIFAVENKDDEW